MKHLCLRSAAAVAAVALMAIPQESKGSGTMDVLGVAYQVDTLAHLKVGPGTTTTYLRLTSPSAKQLQVHYLTIDKSTPGVSIRAVCGKDMVAGTERVSSMAERHSDANHLYFAGSNADFFTTSGNASNGSSKVGSPTTSCTVDGEIYKTSNSQYQFSVDREGVARIGRLNYYTGTATKGDQVTLFKGVNVASPNNGITLYTPKYWGSTNQGDKAGNCKEVTAKLVGGEKFTAGGKFRLEVTSSPSDGGDTPIPSDGYVIHGRGSSTSGCNTGAIDFVGSLSPGDVVEFDNVVLLGDERIYPMQIVSGNPKNVGGGATLDTESERGDAKDLHPRTGIGVSEDGNTIIMMVVEGRHSGSAGVRTSQLADIMRYAGAYEAVNLDGGGSSTLYTSAFGVRNYCSDGTERAVGNGIFAVVEAQADDKEITEIQFADWAPRLPVHARYTPRILGFNKYGVVVTDSLTDYTLDCAPELGDVVDNGVTLYASGAGMHALRASYNGHAATVAVNVDADCAFSSRLSKLLIDDKREYAIELMANNGVKVIPVDPKALSWSSDNTEAVTVDENGVVSGIVDGTAVVTGTVGDEKVEIAVTVEVATAPKVNLLEGYDASEWKFTKTGCNASTAVSPFGSGVAIDYTVSSTRGLTLSLAPSSAKYLWSLPEGLEVEVTTSSPLKTVNLKFNDSAGGRFSATGDAVAAGETGRYAVKFDEFTNTADLAVFPIRFSSVSLTPDAKTGDSGHIEVPYLNVVYATGSGVEAVRDDLTAPACDDEPVYYNLQGMRIAKPATGIYIERRGDRAVKRVMK